MNINTVTSQELLTDLGQNKVRQSDIETSLPQLHEDTIKLSLAGELTQEEIAKKLGTSKAGVYRILKRQGLTTDIPRISSEKRAQIVTLLTNGDLTYKQIADQLSICRTSVINVLKQQGVDANRAKRLHEQAKKIREKAVELYLTGNYTRKQVAELLGISKSTVDRGVREHRALQ